MAMRYALAPVLAACYAPSAEIGIPCASNFDCPATQRCNRTVSPPTCGTEPVGDAGAADAPGDAGALGPWGPPMLVAPPAGLEDDPTLTDDLRELYFNRDQTQIWRIRRAAPGAPWSAAEPVVDLDPATTPELSGDGLTIYLASERTGTTGQNDIWIATRPVPGAAWSMPVRIAELSSTAEETNPTPSRDQLALALTRRVSSVRGAELHLATRPSPGAPWGPLQLLAELNTAQSDGDAMLTTDQRAIYFYSTRAGMGDLYVATRSSTAEPFAAPQPISELNTIDFVEQDPWISPDGRHLFFASDRSGEMALYESVR